MRLGPEWTSPVAFDERFEVGVGIVGFDRQSSALLQSGEAGRETGKGGFVLLQYCLSAICHITNLVK